MYKVIVLGLVFSLVLQGTEAKYLDISHHTNTQFVSSETVIPSDSSHPTKIRPVQDRKWTTKYDAYFKKYTKQYFSIEVDWLWFKSQSIAESALNEDAESWCKAKGLMQLMPATFAEVVKKDKSIPNFLSNPNSNIAAGIYYDRQLWNSWKVERPFNDRMAFTFASYNAGIGNILKAQKICNSNRWKDIVQVASKVTSWKCSETIGYVKRIFGFMNESV